MKAFVYYQDGDKAGRWSVEPYKASYVASHTEVPVQEHYPKMSKAEARSAALTLYLAHLKNNLN